MAAPKMHIEKEILVFLEIFFQGTSIVTQSFNEMVIFTSLTTKIIVKYKSFKGEQVERLKEQKGRSMRTSIGFGDPLCKE